MITLEVIFNQLDGTLGNAVFDLSGVVHWPNASWDNGGPADLRTLTLCGYRGQVVKRTALKLWCFISVVCGFEAGLKHGMGRYEPRVPCPLLCVMHVVKSCYKYNNNNNNNYYKYSSEKGFALVFWQWLLNARQHFVSPYKVLHKWVS